MTSAISDSWDDWFGTLALEGIDPRGWDLNTMLAAFEATLKRGAKDEAAAQRIMVALSAEPLELRKRRRAAERAGVQTPGTGDRMTVDDAEAMMARFAAADAAYG